MKLTCGVQMTDNANKDIRQCQVVIRAMKKHETN